MELLAPAGNVEKLKYAYLYGADASYIGLKNFSLRIKADNFYEDEYKKVIELKKQFPEKRLHCALNISFHNNEIDRLRENIPYFKQYPIDAFIVQDLGVVPIIQKEFPDAELHLSTQASCMNKEAVKMYQSIGFKRVVMGREASVQEIAEIKQHVPEMEIECFVHGAMCIAYAGRCLMSAYLNGRSAQSGFCSHTCRWDYDVLSEDPMQYPAAVKDYAQSGKLYLREHKRPDDLFPVYEGENFTAVMSSKDLCMIDHLADLKKAGVDSLKIEGRMKSVYYVAQITRAYRKALDALDGKLTDAEAKPFVDELYNVSHRPFTTAFYYNKVNADVAVSGASDSPYELAAQTEPALNPEAEAEVLKRGETARRRIQSEYDALCPQAQEAWKKRVEARPDMHLPQVEKKEGWKMYPIKALNMINQETELYYVSPNTVRQKICPSDYQLVNPENGDIYMWVCADHPCVIYTKLDFEEGTLLCSRDPDFVEGQVRDNGR